MVRGVFKPTQRIGHQAFGPVTAKRLGGAGDVFADLAGGLHQPAAGIQGLVLSGLGVQLVQLAHGVTQEILFGLHLFQRGTGLVQSAVRFAAGAPGVAGGGDQIGARHIGIQ